MLVEPVDASGGAACDAISAGVTFEAYFAAGVAGFTEGPVSECTLP